MKKEKILSLFLNVFISLFLVISLILLFFAIVSKKSSDGGIKIFNHQIRIVISPSMEKNDETYDQIKKYKIKDIKTKSLVLIKCMPEENQDNWYENINKGDVLTFKYTYDNKQETITHRVVSCEKNQDRDGYTIILIGDNKSENAIASVQEIDTSIENNTNYVIGKVVGKSYIIGVLLYSLKQPIGIALLVIVPSILIIIFEIIKIVNYLNEEKKKKLIEEQDKQLEEIELLKKKIAELEQKNDN